MDPRLLHYYNEELQFVREAGAEFAAEFPKIAGRLGIEAFDCADPYVERLLEGFAFLAARIQLKLDAEFPRFTQRLLEVVCPHYLCPLPSMAVVQFEPDLTEGALADGFVIPRHTQLRSLLGQGEQTRCIYRTAHEVTLYPLELSEASYYTRDMAALNLPDLPGVKAAVLIQLRTTAGLKVQELSLDKLPLFIRGTADIPTRIYEQLMANAAGIMVRSGDGSAAWSSVLGRQCVKPKGFADEESLLPHGPRSFQGYRQLQEYFALPERYMFVELSGLAPVVQSCSSDLLEIAILLDRVDNQLANRVEPENFGLYCSPAINLFEKRADRIHLSHRFSEYHVVPDRTRPMDLEVYQVEAVHGHGTTAEDDCAFTPLYSISDETSELPRRAYYTVTRQPRVLSGRQRRFGPRSSYVGSEVFLSLVDSQELPISTELRQLSVRTLCTNRDLPLQMPVGIGDTDFSMEESAPVLRIRCVSGPTQPRPSRSFAEGQTVWRLISHLALNYLSLLDSPGQGAAALRELLSLYADGKDVLASNQIEGIHSVEARSVTRPITSTGPLSFGRGLEINLKLDEAAFEGCGAFLLAAVMEQFLAKYVSINSFTETVFHSVERGEVMRWPARTGRRQIL